MSGSHTAPPAPSAEPIDVTAVRAADGDWSAVEALYREYSDKLWRYANRLCGGSRDMADDITQETWFKVYARLGSFDPARGSFAGWLFRIARNVMVDHLRRDGRELAKGVSASMLAGDGVSDPTPGPAEVVEARSQTEAVARAVAALPRRQREALLLTGFEEMTVAEAADVLGVSVSTVKTARWHGAQALARHLPTPTAGVTSATPARRSEPSAPAPA